MERVGAFYTYANPYSLPRAWTARSAVFQSTHADSVVALTQLGVLPDTVLITGPDEPADDMAEGISPTAEVYDLSPNAVKVSLEGGGGGYLFLADSIAPGWRAFAEGQELAVRTAYVAFRAVPVPREADRVLFRYEPDDFRVGLFITLLALGCVGATGGCAIASRRG
jgi:hypothetical protein